MKIVEEHIRRVVMTVAALTLAALLAARFLARPALAFMRQNSLELVLGCGLAALGLFVWTAGQTIYLNLKAIRRIEKRFPRTREEIQKIGIETPVDFAFMMGVQLLYHRYTLFKRKPVMTLCADPRLLKLGRDHFREMFGRDPLGGDTGDWEEIMKQETAAFRHCTVEELKQSDLNSSVSERVKRSYLARRVHREG